MKRLLLAMILILTGLIFSTAYAIDWIYTNQATIAWNAVGAIAPDDTLTYRVYMKKLPKGKNIVVGDTSETEHTLTFNQEGRFVVGVRAVRIPTGETEEIVSNITWGDSTDLVAVPVPFGIKYFESPLGPKGLMSK